MLESPAGNQVCAELEQAESQKTLAWQGFQN
jgi:hypothetical protein